MCVRLRSKHGLAVGAIAKAMLSFRKRRERPGRGRTGARREAGGRHCEW